LARRASVIRDLKKEGKELLTLDAGNSLFKARGSPSTREREKARLIAMAYQRMGYQAVNIGSYDLAAGIEFLRKLQQEVHLPLVSANLLDEKGGKPVFKTHMVLDVSGMRVGLLGLTSDAHHDEGVTPEGYFISDPLSAAKTVVAELAKECDIIVALSNLGSFKEYAELTQQVKDFQFIFGSGERKSYHQTIRSDGRSNTLLFQTYPKGQYLGTVGLKVVIGDHYFLDLSRRAHLERQIESIERQLEFYRRGTGRAKSIPQDKREEYIKRFEEYKTRSEARLMELEREFQGKSTFINTSIRLDGKIREDPEIKELVNRFKKGS
jgi:5'-nucleotidase/UDP-sugar diphosphatase